MSAWGPLLDLAGVESHAPRPVPDGLGQPDAAAALRDAGGPPASAPGTPLLVVVNDPDRATDTAPALAAVRAAASGRPLRVLVSTGSHRHGDDARRRHESGLRDAAGPGAAWRWHDPSDDAQVDVGGVRVDPWLAEARDAVGIGSIEPHWFAGLTGAHKTLSVGLMTPEGIAASHRLALAPGARPLRLAGNPVHEEITRTYRALAAGRVMLGLQHVEARWIAGDPLDALEDCLAFARARWSRTVEVPLDFLVAVVAPPLDRVLYQAEKGLKNSEDAVRDGGAIVIDAACRDGIGPRRFLDLLARAPDHPSAVALLGTDGYRLGDHKAVRLRALQERGVTIAVVSTSIEEADARSAGIRTFPNRATATAWILDRFGEDARGVVARDAAHLVMERG